MYLAEVPQHVTTLARFTALRSLTLECSDYKLLSEQVCLVMLQLHVSCGAMREAQPFTDLSAYVQSR